MSISSTAFASSLGVTLSSRPVQLSKAARTPLRTARRPRCARMVVGEEVKADSSGDPSESPPPKVNAKDFAKLYGGSYLATSTFLAVISYSTWYLLVRSGVDVVALVQSLGNWLATTPIGRPSILNRIDATVGTATLAYIAHKASSPFRFPITVALTPVVARAFKKGSQTEGDSVGKQE